MITFPSTAVVDAGAAGMSAKSLVESSKSFIIPILFVSLYVLGIYAAGNAADLKLPRWYNLAIIATLIVLERVYVYRYAMSQKHVLVRDVLSSFVNIFISATLTAMILLPLLVPVIEYFLGRNHLIASPDQLGPLWFQVIAIMLLGSFYRYWMHRWQHSNEFLWKLHSYHHSVTDLKGSNTYVSHPIDWSLRNAVPVVLLGLAGFDLQALLIAAPVSTIAGIFSHCGGDVRGGVFNYLFMTPEVHRWHHAADTPKGHKYAVNYGVEFSFWDMLFGTFHLPKENRETLQPARLGHPGGLPDEGNYARLLLKPLGLWPSSWGERKPQQVPAE
jgi:sterol desaturase/sphingolipid hydroxylase (fatty acid hydroxylase superfamily)